MQRDPRLVAPVEIGGARTVLVVPLLKEGEVIGAFSLYRQEARIFPTSRSSDRSSFCRPAAHPGGKYSPPHELRQRTDELGRSTAESQRERSNKLMNMEAMAALIGHEAREPRPGIASNAAAARRFLGHAPPNLDEAGVALNRMISDAASRQPGV